MINKGICAWVVGTVLAGSLAATHGAEPTHKNVRYSKEYERSVMDIWTVKSDKPAPLVVYFHGGGFTAGDKQAFHRSPFIKKYHPEGVAFATVNYPFREHTGNSVMAILKHTAEAIKFLRSSARKYNIDSKRISVMGSSAGALISEYLGHGAKLSIRSVFANQQPMGTPILIVPILHKGGPSIVVYNSSGPGDNVHHPDNARAVYNRCKRIGVHCELYGSKQSGLPEVPKGRAIHDVVMKVFYSTWRLPHPDKRREAEKRLSEIEKEAEPFLAKAEEAVKNEAYAEARAILKKVCRDYKGSKSAGKALEKLKQLSNNPAFAAKVRADAAAKALARARTLLQAKEYSAAIGSLENITKLYEGTTAATQAAGQIEALRADPAIASALYREAAKKECRGWLAMAKNYISNKMPTEAKPYLDKIIKKYPGTSYAAEARKLLKTM